MQLTPYCMRLVALPPDPAMLTFAALVAAENTAKSIAKHFIIADWAECSKKKTERDLRQACICIRVGEVGTPLTMFTAVSVQALVPMPEF